MLTLDPEKWITLYAYGGTVCGGPWVDRNLARLENGRNGWRLTWFEIASDRTAELQVPSKADLVKLLSLGPEELARRVRAVRDHAAEVFGVDVLGLSGGWCDAGDGT